MSKSFVIICAISMSLACLLSGLFASAMRGTPADAGDQPPPTQVERSTVLPPPEARSTAIIGLTYKDSTPGRIETVQAPPGAPNVVIVLLDDVGFGAAGTFGGPIPTPTLDRLARRGLRYNRFHTTALCSPTRAALITGRNHHAVGMGTITETATAYEGYSSIIPKSAASIAEVLRQNGYNTSAWGKWHMTPIWEVSATGPFDRWPTGMGFESWYGFHGGESHQYDPALYDNTTPVERPNRSDYHLTEDLADRAIAWMRLQKAVAPGQPFFVYWAPGATHAPHHVPKEWVAKFRGQFDRGWDRMREETFARQKELGVIPAHAQLTPRPRQIPAYESLPEERQRIAARLMETYAGFLAHTDAQVGKLVDALEGMGQFDNTLFLYIVGDNGASGEGTPFGVFNEMSILNGVPEDPAVVLRRLDEIGGPTAYNHYPVGWAWAMDTPFQWTKQIASHFGGTRNPMVVTWPRRIKDAGGVRPQFHHCIDVVPTLLEVTGIPAPAVVNGVAQKPIEGVSLAYTFDDPKAEGQRRTQYFEMFANRALYHEGWIASVFHGRTPWETARPTFSFADETWELYHLDEDFSQAHDLAGREPQRLRELQDLFWVEAGKYHVLPLDDRLTERGNDPSIPVPGRDRTSFTYYPGAIRIPEGVAPDVKNKSHRILAEIEVPAGGADGVLAAQGGTSAGWSLYVSEGRLTYAYNFFGSQLTRITAREKLPAGEVSVRYEFAYDGGGRGKGGTGRLFVNGELVAQGQIPNTAPYVFSVGDTFDIGMDAAAPVDDRYAARKPFAFTGRVKKVEVDLGDGSKK